MRRDRLLLQRRTRRSIRRRSLRCDRGDVLARRRIASRRCGPRVGERYADARRTRDRSTAPGSSCRPGSSTCTAICASRGARKSRRSRPARARRRPADSRRCARCRTPIPSPTTRRRSDSSSGRRSAPNAARVYPIGAISVGQKGESLAEFGEMVGAGAVAVSDDGKPVVERASHAHGARVRAHVRHSRRRPLRGADARARRRDERGDRQRAPRPQGNSGRGRRDHGDPRHPPRAAHGRARSSLPHEHARIGRADSLGQGARHQRDGGSVPASSLADGRRGRGLRHEREDEPAAAHGGRRRGAAGSGARRNDRSHRDRPRAAPLRREGARVRRCAERHRRSRDGAGGEHHLARGARDHRSSAARSSACRARRRASSSLPGGTLRRGARRGRHGLRSGGELARRAVARSSRKGETRRTRGKRFKVVRSEPSSAAARSTSTAA